jgi:hypothetical protein
MIPIDEWQVCAVPLGGLKFLKRHLPLKFLKNNKISGASLVYHFSNDQC